MNTPPGASADARYARHTLIPGWDQRALADATVVLVGAGALGNTVAQSLALAGIGRLVVCDPDTVAVSNLSRCPLFRAADVGRPKAEALAEALAALAPDTVVDARPAPLLSGVGLAELRDADLAVGCLDSRAARLRLAARCTLAGVPMLDGGTNDWGGEVGLYRPGGRCWGCGLTPAERAAQDDPWSCTAPRPGQRAGASAPVSAIVGSWLAGYAVRVLLGLPVAAWPLRIDAAGSALPVAGRGPVDRPAPDCPLHEEPGPVSVLPVADLAPVGDLLRHFADDEEPLSWTGFRRPGAPLAAPASATRLRAAAPDATLRSLGVAPREILPVAGPRGTLLRYVELSPGPLPQGAARPDERDHEPAAPTAPGPEGER